MNCLNSTLSLLLVTSTRVGQYLLEDILYYPATSSDAPSPYTSGSGHPRGCMYNHKYTIIIVVGRMGFGSACEIGVGTDHLGSRH